MKSENFEIYIFHNKKEKKNCERRVHWHQKKVITTHNTTQKSSENIIFSVIFTVVLVRIGKLIKKKNMFKLKSEENPTSKILISGKTLKNFILYWI